MAGNAPVTDPETFLEATFSDRSDHLQEWNDLILGDDTARDSLRDALIELRRNEASYNSYTLVPQPDRNILRALTFKPPSEIKALIVAYDPIPDVDNATGLAFSLSKNKTGLSDNIKQLLQKLREKIPENTDLSDNFEQWLKGIKVEWNGLSMVKMKLALQEAGLEDADDYNLCYKHWAERGVFLWNAALTLQFREGYRSERHDYWLPFSRRLLYLVLKAYDAKNPDKGMLGMFWGSNAATILEGINVIEAEADGDVNTDNCQSYDHPTFTLRRDAPNDFIENATEQFRSNPDLFGIRTPAGSDSDDA